MLDKNNGIFFLLMVILVAVLSNFASYSFKLTKPKDTSYVVFLDDLKSANIKSANMVGTEHVVEYVDKFDISRRVVLPKESKDYIDRFVEKSIPVILEEPSSNLTSSFFFNIFASCVPVILLVGCLLWMARKNRSEPGFANQFSKSKARLYKPDELKVTLNDVAGCQEDITEIVEIIDFLKNPNDYKNANAEIPHGILLSGPPGVGKTHICKAIAAEVGVPFYYVSGSDFNEMFVGTGASRVRDMFEDARHNTPCIIFIDEIDSIGSKRGTSANNKENDNTLNQLLVQMDGFSESEGIIVMGATNRVDTLDSALLRPGRFDRLINVSLPDFEARRKIFDLLLTKKTIAKNVNVEKLAKGTPGFSGAEISNLVNEAAIFAAREKRSTITSDDLENAKDKVVMGIESPKTLSEKEITLTAYHECGHAIVGYLSPEHDNVYKVSIIPRSNSLGVTMFLPEEISYSNSKAKLLSEISALLGGRAAEEIMFGEDKVTTGASNDIERATAIAYSMVTKWGLSDIGIGFFGKISRYGEYEVSSDMSKKIDEEVQKILNMCYNNAKELLNANKNKLMEMSTLLIAKETLVEEDINQLMTN